MQRMFPRGNALGWLSIMITACAPLHQPNLAGLRSPYVRSGIICSRPRAFDLDVMAARAKQEGLQGAGVPPKAQLDSLLASPHTTFEVASFAMCAAFADGKMSIADYQYLLEVTFPGLETMSGDLPEASDFPLAGLRYGIRGDPDSILGNLSGELSKRLIPYSMVDEGDERILVTSYVPEPDSVGLRRVARAAVKVSVPRREEGAAPPCTPLALSWLVELRGARERNWARTKEGYRVPTVAKEVASLLKGDRCNPG